MCLGSIISISSLSSWQWVSWMSVRLPHYLIPFVFIKSRSFVTEMLLRPTCRLMWASIIFGRFCWTCVVKHNIHAFNDCSACENCVVLSQCRTYFLENSLGSMNRISNFHWRLPLFLPLARGKSGLECPIARSVSRKIGTFSRRWRKKR